MGGTDTPNSRLTQKLNKCVAVLVASSDTSATFVFQSPSPGFVWTGTLNCAGAPYNAIFTATIGNVSWGNWAGNSVYGPIQAEGGEQLIVTMTLASAIGVATSLEMCWLGSVDEVGMVAPIWPDANSSSQQTQLVGAINANITGGSLSSVGSITNPVGVTGTLSSTAPSTVVNAPTTTAGYSQTQSWATGLLDPSAAQCAIDSSGNIYVANYSLGTVTKITAAGVVTSSWATVGGNPSGIAVDSSGNVFVNNAGSSTISKITPAGVVTLTWATYTGSASNLAIDSSGNVYVPINSSNTITKITSAGVVTSSWATVGSSPNMIVLDAANNLYVANGTAGTISKVTSGGVVTLTWATVGALANRLAIDSSGNVFVTCYSPPTTTIYKVTSAGTPSVWGSYTGSFGFMVCDSSGNLYGVCGGSSGFVWEITAAGVYSTFFTPTGASTFPVGLVIDSSSNIYVNITGTTPKTMAKLSNGASAGASVIGVTSTSSFSSAGIISYPTTYGTVVLSYTAKTSTTFSGLTMLAGSPTWQSAAGATISQGYTGSATTIPVISSASFPTAGIIAVAGSGGTLTFNYTGTSGTSFTGCTLASGTASWWFINSTPVVIPVSSTGSITVQPNSPGVDTLLNSSNGFTALPATPLGSYGTIMSSNYTGFLIEITGLFANSVISVTLSNLGQNGSSGYNSTQTITRNMTTSSLSQFFFSIPAATGDLITLSISGSVSTSGQVAVIAYRANQFTVLENNPLHMFQVAELGGGSYVSQSVTTSSVLVVGMGALAAGLSYRLHSWSVDTIPTAGKVELWDNSTTGRVFGIIASTNTQTTQFLGGVLTPGPVYLNGPALTPATVRACIFYDIVQTPVIA